MYILVILPSFAASLLTCCLEVFNSSYYKPVTLGNCSITFYSPRKDQSTYYPRHQENIVLSLRKYS